MTIEEVLAEFTPPASGWVSVDAGHDRWMLVESSTTGYWFSTHSSMDDAAEYHDNQDYAADYPVKCLIDLTTGQRYNRVVRTIWETQVTT